MADVQRGLHRMVLVLLTALVLVQTLGLLHRVVHGHSALSVSIPSTDGVSPHWQRLWGEHSNAVDCQLFDQSCPDIWHVPLLLVMTVMPASRWVAETRRERFALVERFYAARGPPVWH